MRLCNLQSGWQSTQVSHETTVFMSVYTVYICVCCQIQLIVAVQTPLRLQVFQNKWQRKESLTKGFVVRGRLGDMCSGMKKQ